MPGKYKVYFTTLAEIDLGEIFDYIAYDSRDRASDFIRDLEEKVYSLNMHPERHPLIPENEFFNTDYRHMIHKKYRVIYRVDGSNIYILRIFHGKKLFAP